MAIRRGEVVEVDNDDDDGEPEITLDIMILICAQMEKISLTYGEPGLNIDLSRSLRKFRVHLRRMEGEKMKQATLDKWFWATVEYESQMSHFSHVSTHA